MTRKDSENLGYITKAIEENIISKYVAGIDRIGEQITEIKISCSENRSKIREEVEKQISKLEIDLLEKISHLRTEIARIKTAATIIASIVSTAIGIIGPILFKMIFQQ